MGCWENKKQKKPVEGKQYTALYFIHPPPFSIVTMDPYIVLSCVQKPQLRRRQKYGKAAQSSPSVLAIYKALVWEALGEKTKKNKNKPWFR